MKYLIHRSDGLEGVCGVWRRWDRKETIIGGRKIFVDFIVGVVEGFFVERHVSDRMIQRVQRNKIKIVLKQKDEDWNVSLNDLMNAYGLTVEQVTKLGRVMI